MGALQEEYERLKRQKIAYETTLAKILKGVFSKKNIRGNSSYYRQYREGEKIVSQYVPLGDVPQWEERIAKRKQPEQSLRRVQEELRRLQRVLGERRHYNG